MLNHFELNKNQRKESEIIFLSTINKSLILILSLNNQTQTAFMFFFLIKLLWVEYMQFH